MRLSADKNSKYYNEELVTSKVYLDNNPISHAFEADDVEGWVECCKLDKSGAPYATDNEIATEKLYGSIEFR